jgi:hypothetical protein
MASVRVLHLVSAVTAALRFFSLIWICTSERLIQIDFLFAKFAQPIITNSLGLHATDCSEAERNESVKFVLVHSRHYSDDDRRMSCLAVFVCYCKERYHGPSLLCLRCTFLVEHLFVCSYVGHVTHRLCFVTCLHSS